MKRLTLILICVLQISLTLTDTKHLWPLCPYNMFNKLQATRQTRWHAVLTYANTQRRVELFELIPVEYFKANRMIRRAAELEQSQRREFARALLWRINHQPHRGFDEIYPSPPSGALGLTLVKAEHDLDSTKILGEEVVESWMFEANEV